MKQNFHSLSLTNTDEHNLLARVRTHTHTGKREITVAGAKKQEGHVNLNHDEHIIHPLACPCLPPSPTHSLICALTRPYSQQVIDQSKTADKLYKEMLPKYVSMKSKYDGVKRRGDQAAEKVKGQKQRVALLESELEECRKVCNEAKLSFTFTH